MKLLHIDLETRSRTNLITDGAYNYASCPTTSPLCMAYCVEETDDNTPIDELDFHLWTPDQEIPEDFRYLFEDTDCLLGAHNAEFERLIFEFIICPEYDLRVPDRDRWWCTAYQARCNNLPASLDACSRALRLKYTKDVRGRELIKLLCIPNKKTDEFYSTPELLEELYEYCRQDVRVEVDIYRRLRDMTETESEDFWVAQAINDRGIMIDRELCNAAANYADIETEDLRAEVERLTEGAVIKVRGTKLTDWVYERLDDEQKSAMHVYRNGERKVTLDRQARQRVLSDPDLDHITREVLECSDAAQKASVGKFRAMATRADPETDRVYGAILPNGASASGRFSSRGCQVHNFPRKGAKDPETLRTDIIDDIEPDYLMAAHGGKVMNLLSSLLRYALRPDDGNVFLVGDLDQIEARVAPWLSDSASGREKLQVFIEGQDPYRKAAAAIYGLSEDKISDTQRQTGKVAELALQFGGGPKALIGMGAGYGIKFSDHEARDIRDKWRAANPWAVQLWDACEQAANAALRFPGQPFRAGRVQYFTAPDTLIAGSVTLFCVLPCGRLLTYPDARIEMCETPWGEMAPQLTALKASLTAKVNDREWPRGKLYGGLLTENIVQGTAASVLREMVRNCHHQGIPVVFHVHDEIIAEVSEASAETDREAMHRIMNHTPEWAQGLPISAEIDVMARYGKH